MRDLEVTEKGETFNKSKKGEFVVVHDGKILKYFGKPTGTTSSKKTMFVGTEAECDTYIIDNSIIIITDEIPED